MIAYEKYDKKRLISRQHTSHIKQNTSAQLYVLYLLTAFIDKRRMGESAEQGPFYRISDTKNADLLRERQSATFDVEQLTQFMFGSPGGYFNINRRRELSTIKPNLHFLLSFSSLFSS